MGLRILITALAFTAAGCVHHRADHLAAVRSLSPITPPAFLLPDPIDPADPALEALRTLTPLPLP